MHVKDDILFFSIKKGIQTVRILSMFNQLYITGTNVCSITSYPLPPFPYHQTWSVATQTLDLEQEYIRSKIIMQRFKKFIVHVNALDLGSVDLHVYWPIFRHCSSLHTIDCMQTAAI